MLKLPNKGIATSVKVHNCRLDVVADWVEASALFSGESISQVDCIDHLLEEQVYRDQDFAQEWLSSVWSEVRRRQRWLTEGAPLDITTTRVTPKGDWREFLESAFCLLLSASVWYNDPFPGVPADFPTQGQLFELLTKESLELQLPGWEIVQTGWSRMNAVNLRDVVPDVAATLGERVGEIDPWSTPDAKEAGLDLVCFRPFTDQRVGVPLYLLQCASGKLSEAKMRTPDLNEWGKFIIFAASPRRAHSTPFALTEEAFNRYCNLVDGLLIDRHRLLEPSREGAGWITAELRVQLLDWCEPRVDAMQSMGGAFID